MPRTLADRQAGFKKGKGSMTSKAKASLKKAKATAKAFKPGSANTTYKVWTHGCWQVNKTANTGSPSGGTLDSAQGYGNYWSFPVGTCLTFNKQAAQLCNVFERVKVHKMIVEVMPFADTMIATTAGPTASSATATNNQANQTWAQGTGACQAQTYPLIAGYVDIDDIGSSEPNPTQVLAHPDAWPKPFNKIYKRSFVPGVTTQLETTGVSAASGGTIKSNTVFLNTNTATTVQLSGLKFCVWIPLSGKLHTAV